MPLLNLSISSLFLSLNSSALSTINAFPSTLYQGLSFPNHSSMPSAFLLITFSYVSFADDSVSVSAPAHEPPPPTSSTLNPAIAIAIAILTTFFCITSLLLLYAKHCTNSPSPTAGVRRNNSGVDRSVVESLPIFKFGSLKGQKQGLECSVCLTRFEAPNSLRLLPKCKHAFHVECVDTWLESHSTCPMCRCRVDRMDVLLAMEEPEESMRRISGERCGSDQRRKDGLLMVGKKMEHRILVSRWSDVAPTSDLVCIRGGRCASDMGSDAAALARWTAWISQAQPQAQG